MRPESVVNPAAVIALSIAFWVTPGLTKADTVLLVGTAEEITLWRETPPVPEGWVMADGPCGRYRVTFSVDEVLSGELHSDQLIAEEWLDYCRLRIELTSTYLLEIETGDVNLIVAYLELKEGARDGQLAAKPELAMALGIPDKIEDIDSFGWVAFLVDDDDAVVAEHPEWFGEPELGLAAYTKGIPLREVRALIREERITSLTNYAEELQDAGAGQDSP